VRSFLCIRTALPLTASAARITSTESKKASVANAATPGEKKERDRPFGEIFPMRSLNFLRTAFWTALQMQRTSVTHQLIVFEPIRRLLSAKI